MATNKEHDPEANIGLDQSINAPGNSAPGSSVARVVTSGNNNEFVHIGDTKVYRHELLKAFGGDMYPQTHVAPSRKFANPSPLGLFSFSATLFVLSLINLHARHVTTPNIVVGLAFFYGGAVQLIAGIWEIVAENTFGATVFCSYGAFWLSYAAIYVDSFGIISAYKGNVGELNSALGFYLVGWIIFTVLVTICTLRSTVALFSWFFFLAITVVLLAAGIFSEHVGVTKASGWFGVITAFIGWYNAFAGLANSDNFFFNIRAIPMPFAKKLD